MSAEPEWMSHSISMVMPADRGTPPWYACTCGQWKSDPIVRPDLELHRAAERAGADHVTEIARAGSAAYDASLAADLDALGRVVDQMEGLA